MIELDWLTFIGLLCVSGLIGAVGNDSFLLWRKRKALGRRTGKMPLLLEPEDVEPLSENPSLEKHVEVVNYVNRLLSKETERLQDELRTTHSKTD
jgi:hypothetical protein